ncbi:MAG: tryptophan-rich sensory protein [Patescibacteria group bacterium]|nr:tryptophan-rich sensory protein [Patescibacteria group bacterium]
MSRNVRLAFALLVSLALVALTGFAGSLYTISSVTAWYPALVKSPLTPPSFVFGPVWTALYALMAFSAWRVYEARIRKPAAYRDLIVYGLHLIVNAAWSYAFFGLRDPRLALAVILALLFLVAYLTYRFWKIDRVSGWCFVPYLLWVAFAAYLNLSIVLLN